MSDKKPGFAQDGYKPKPSPSGQAVQPNGSSIRGGYQPGTPAGTTVKPPPSKK